MNATNFDFAMTRVSRDDAALPLVQAQRRFSALAAACLGVLLITAALTLTIVVLPTVREARLSEAWVEHTHLVIESTGKILGGMTDAETGQRGFLLTNQDSLLLPYRKATTEIWQNWANMQALTADNPHQQARLNILRSQMQGKLALMARTIALARVGDQQGALALLRIGQGAALMSAIRATCAAMVDEEQHLLARRRAHLEATQHVSDGLILISILFMCLCLLVTVITALHAWRAAVAWRRATSIAAAERLAHIEREAVQARNNEVSQRALAAELRETNERLSQATESGAIGLWEWNATLDETIWNSVMFRLYGMRPSKAPKHAAWLDRLHVEDRRSALRTLSGAIATASSFAHEFRVVGEDGRIRTLRSTGKVTRDTEGGAVRLRGATWDVTAERVAQEQRMLLGEQAPNGLMIVDEAGTITLANGCAERLFDYPKGGLLGQSVDLLVSDAFRPRHSELRAAFSAGRCDQSMQNGRDVLGRKRDGSQVMVEVTLRSVQTPRGRIVVVALTDCTLRQLRADDALAEERRERLAAEAHSAELARMSEELACARDTAENANRAKSHFLRGMSHELRTPLNGILGYVQLLHMGGDLNTQQNERLDAMREAGQHLLQMINCVLDLSQIEADHLELRPVSVDVQCLAEACLDLVRPLADAKGLQLCSTTLPGARRDICADPTRLRQVLYNLLGNAVKFTGEGRVALRLSPAEDPARLRIEVIDTGAGIPEDQAANLFSEFGRMDNDMTRATEGCGLGLALSARIVALMGGAIGHAKNPVGGSIFWLELPTQVPLLAPVKSASPPPLMPQQPSTTVPALHILVVDDVLMNRDIAGCFLSAAGHRVTCVEDGESAIAAVEATSFDIVLMDVRMPTMDGLEATRRIRALATPHRHVPIIGLTAHVFAEQVAECHIAGMNAHLAKPFNMQSLIDVMTRTIASADETIAQ